MWEIQEKSKLFLRKSEEISFLVKPQTNELGQSAVYIEKKSEHSSLIRIQIFNNGPEKLQELPLDSA